MATDPAEREELVYALAAEIGFDVDDGMVADVLGTVDGIRESYEALSTFDGETASAEGELSDDPYGALLHVYDEPRSTGAGGPLDGVTVAAKDNVAIAGLTMTCGADAFEYVPSFDALVIERLLDAGASVVGKANSDVWAFGPTGEFSERRTVVNPAAEDRVPGGSSSGSAAAVRGGLVDVALGSDTGGSIRIPAACCGVVGAKPTHGLVPKHGFVELAPSTDTVGPLARDADTATRALAAMAGPSTLDRAASTVDGDDVRAQYEADDDLAVGVPDAFYDRSDDDVNAVVRGVLDALDERDGVTVEDVSVDLSRLEDAYPLVIGSEASRTLRDDFVTRGNSPVYAEEWADAFVDAAFTEHVALRVLPGAFIDAATAGRSYAVARSEADRFTRELADRFADVDVLVTPTMRTVPPTRGNVDPTQGMEAIYGNTGPLSLTGLPAVSVPAGTVGGVPVGAQIISPRFEDGVGLRAAALVEDVRDDR